MRKITSFFLCISIFCLILSGCKNSDPIPTKPTLPPSDYRIDDFYHDGEFLACSKTDVILGIDVSHHQGIIDWQAVADAGVEFVFIRLGYRGLTGGALHVDDMVQENLQGARKAGLQLGAYFYSQAVSVQEARQEAAFALEILGDTPLDLPLVFDWEQEERTMHVPVDVATDSAIAFCEDVKLAGYQPMVYFNSYQAQHLMDLFRLEDYPWWLAMYDLEQDFPCRMDIWQYSDTGSIPGIEGDVDLNILFPQENTELS